MRSLKVKNLFQSKTIISFVLLCLLLTTITVQADPTIEINPSKPKPLSTVEITVNANDETVDAVYIVYQECESADLCHLANNVTLTETSTNMFSKTIALEWEDATYMQYTIIMHNPDGYTEYAKNTKVNLDLTVPDNGGNGGGNGGDPEDSPGFELIAFALSLIAVSFILYRRKK